MKRRYISIILDEIVRRRANAACEYCQLPQESQEARFHIDHVKPLAQKGRTTASNLALACVTCSLKKSARVSASDPLTGKNGFVIQSTN